jgi:hypothetical protein
VSAATLIVQLPLFLLMLGVFAMGFIGLAHAFFEGVYVTFDLVELLKGLATAGICWFGLREFYLLSQSLAGGVA